MSKENVIPERHYMLFKFLSFQIVSGRQSRNTEKVKLPSPSIPFHPVKGFENRKIRDLKFHRLS